MNSSKRKFEEIILKDTQAEAGSECKRSQIQDVEQQARPKKAEIQIEIAKSISDYNISS